MKMSRYNHAITLCAMALLIIAVGTQPASAQDDDRVKVEKEVKVMVDEDGNVTVNGEPFTGDRMELGDGTVVIKDENGKVMVMETEDGDRKIVRKRKTMRPGSGERVQVFKMKDGDDEFVWHGAPGEHTREAMDHMRHMRFGGMLGEDFDFEFDFDHMNPEVMEMEAASRKLAKEVRKAEGSDKAQKERELSEKLEQIFDKKLENRRQRITKLQERLEKERAALTERQRSRSQIVERRKAELLGDDALKW